MAFGPALLEGERLVVGLIFTACVVIVLVTVDDTRGARLGHGSRRWLLNRLNYSLWVQAQRAHSPDRLLVRILVLDLRLALFGLLSIPSREHDLCPSMKRGTSTDQIPSAVM